MRSQQQSVDDNEDDQSMHGDDWDEENLELEIGEPEKQELEVEIVEQRILFLIPPLPSRKARKKKANDAEVKRATPIQVEEKKKKKKINKQIAATRRSIPEVEIRRFRPPTALIRRHRLASGTLALNSQFLKKKLERSGGLSVWLNSKGLGRFAPVLQRNRIGENELLDLTMDALKQIGVDAVGPRRKLLAAIRQLCLISTKT